MAQPALSDTARKALLAQTCCGDAALCDFLSRELDFIYMCQDPQCNAQARYLYTLLGMIEAAQIYSRNRIDTIERRFADNLQERYTAFQERHTDAESTSTGRSCQWSAATSSQFFFRDSTDDLVSFSELDSLHTSERLESGYDRSYRVTTGHGFSFSRVIHTLDDKEGERLAPGEGFELSRSSRASSTNGGTGPLLPIVGTKWNTPITLDTSPPYVHTNLPGPLLTVTPASNSDQVCPPFDPLDPDKDLCRDPKLNYPSYGIGYHGKIHFEISVQVIGTGTMQLQWTWEEGANFRQYYHCTSSAVHGTATTNGRDAGLATGRTIALPGDNRTSSRETTSIYHLVRKFGTSTRRGTTNTDAEEVTKGRSKGEAHSESNRDSHGQAFTQRRAESLTTNVSESHERQTEKLTDDEVRRSYGQIGTQLSVLWNLIWDRIQLLERAYVQNFAAGQMCCPTERPGCKCPSLYRPYTEMRNGIGLSGYRN
jgi:hypothetical protein